MAKRIFLFTQISASSSQSKVKFLGFIIEDRKVKMDNVKVDGISKWPLSESWINICQTFWPS